ncbi:MAG: (2Fe-2S) ferredoxin domain-containing protein [Peptococcaceae bacterium]|nr:(2Fe-2S) ferredoxin domain-containing protein [Peptococcaceae bacterium]
MEITICIGSSCHLKGAREIVSKLEKIIEKCELSNQIHLKGAFCMGKCSVEGVSVKVEDELFYLKPENVEQFFQDEILRRL